MHTFQNIKKSAQIGDAFWDVMNQAGLLDIVVGGSGDGRTGRGAATTSS